VTKATQKRLTDMRSNPQLVSFSDAPAVAAHFFGEPRISGGHHIFKMPWPGDPRINLQKTQGGAKPYQVRQLLAAIDKLTAGRRSGVTKMADHFTYRVAWSEEDGEYVGSCAEFPSLSHLDGDQDAALRGVRGLVADVVEDMRARRAGSRAVRRAHLFGQVSDTRAA
jgi:hypothetical protein